MCSLMFCISACVIGVQVLSAMGLGKVFGLPDGAALLPFGAFFGAHGIPQVIAGIYDTLGYWNYDEASAFGTTYATIGMLYGIIAGIIILNIGIRKGWVSAEKSGNLSDEDYTGILKKEHRVKFMKSYTSDIAFDPLTMHFAIVMAIMIVAYGLLEVLHKIPLFSGFAIYVPAIIVSLVAGIILRKTPLGDFLDSESLAHIGSLALEYLIVTAIATMKLDVIMNNAGAILTISLVGLALTTIVLMTLPRLWLKEHWLENAMVMFGSWTGSTATGMMLLRIADPELETDPVADQYAELLPHHRALLHRHCDRLQKPCAGYDRNAAGGIVAGICDREKITLSERMSGCRKSLDFAAATLLFVQ